MNLMRTVKSVAVVAGWTVAAAMLLTACGDNEPSTLGTMRFVLINQSEHELRNPVITGTNRPVSFMNAAPGAAREITDNNLNIPRTIEVSWTDIKGDRQTRNANLGRAVSSDYVGTVLFIVRANEQLAVEQAPTEAWRRKYLR